MTVGRLLASAAARLKAAGVGSAPFEAQLMLAYALHRDRVWLTVHRDLTVNAAGRSRFERMVRARITRRPLQQILGETEFYGYRVFVDRRVLIPRPETELLVEQVTQRWQPWYRAILDIGTGSGCIAVALAKQLPRARITGTDISARALEVARKNVAYHRLLGRIKLVKADLLPAGRTKYDVVISNPPYIPSRKTFALQPEVSQFEPVAALDGGVDGLDFYRRIIAGTATRLSTGGMIALEIGEGQAQAVRTMFPASFTVTVLPDLCRIPRMVIAVK
jgi:release factor glutamine methyltransferase